MTEILYRSDRLEVRHVPAGDGRCRVVTFDSYHEPAGLDRRGFGESFFSHEAVTAIHVMSHGNDWFQYAEIEHVLALIRAACEGAERVLAYGSSMGGYAALRFAAAIGADAALALSPQYSLDPRKVPFETRWASDRRRIRFLPALDGVIRQGPRMIVAFDATLAIDRRHVDLLLRDAPMTALRLPYGGHPVGGFLNDIGLLRPLVLTALDGSFDAPRFRRAAHARRSRSAQWLAHLADRQPPHRNASGIRLALRAVEMAPDRPALHAIAARRLAAAGRYPDAIAAHQRAIALEPIVDYLWGLSKTLHAAGDDTGALVVAERIQALAPHSAGYHAWAARLRGALGDRAGQIADLRRALRHDPANRGYRWQLFSLRWRSRLAWLRGKG